MSLNEKQPSRASSFLRGFLPAFLGIFIGGLLLLPAYEWYSLTFRAGKELMNQNYVNSAHISFFQEDYQYGEPESVKTALVSAVEEVVPAVVGIIIYAPFSQRGRELQVEQATGSGVVIHSEGYIITNYHVIEGASEIKVSFGDGKTVNATLVGKDPYTDLAILKVDLAEPLKTAVFADSDQIRPGETVIAIGNPLGFSFQHTVTAGIISATQRQIHINGTEYRHTYLQTDAAINQGNSGGPLVNTEGKIIGINSAKIIDPRVEGMGFAIPSNTARLVAEKILQHGEVVRPFMGILVADLFEVTGMSNDQGVYIREVYADSPAEKAGLEAGDVIVEIDSHPTEHSAQLFDRLLHLSPGDETKMEVLREDDRLSFQIFLEDSL